jgi:hypothetical protein
MDTKKILSWLLFFFGEALLLTAFVLFSGGLPGNIVVLNIVVSSVIYGLFFVDVLVPWVDLGDRSQRRVGSLGGRWFFTWVYALLAIAVMLLANMVYSASFATQAVVHGVLLFLLLLGFIFTRHSFDKVEEVFADEVANRSEVAKMKQAAMQLKDKASTLSGLPEAFVGRIVALEENMRYISPANNSEARMSERLFVDMANSIAVALEDFSLNEEKVEQMLGKCEQLYQNRKQIYST